MGLRTDRRRFLTTAVVASLELSGYSLQSSTDATEAGQTSDAVDQLPDTVGLATLDDGLELPTAVEFAADADRRYVAERDGRIYVYGSDGRLDEPFLDLRDAVLTDGERGLLGLALHPDFDENRRVFRIIAPRDGPKRRKISTIQAYSRSSRRSTTAGERSGTPSAPSSRYHSRGNTTTAAISRSAPTTTSTSLSGKAGPERRSAKR